jgi:hypothetical protein
MTTLINTVTNPVQIQGNHSTIQYLDHNIDLNQVTAQEDIAVAKSKTIDAILDKSLIDDLNHIGINALDKTKHALLNQLNTELNRELLTLLDTLHKPQKPNRFKRFLYWLTQSTQLFHIKSPEHLYAHILTNCYWQRLFVIAPPNLIHIFKSHPHFNRIDNTDYEQIQLIGHINSNPIFVNNAIHSNYIQTGSQPNTIYHSATTPQFIVTETATNQTKIQLSTKTILHHIPQPLNRFYNFNATTKPLPFYKKLLKL